MKFSANLGFLWNDRPLPDAIRAAKKAGFDAVECHWPYDVPAAEVAAALNETGLTMLGLNTRRGDVAAGDNGLTAVPEREDAARAAIDEAVDYARAIGAVNIHVMAGYASGEAARQCFVRGLRYACEKADPHGITILIEPLNRYDAPGYFLTTSAQAVKIIDAVAAPNLKLMFDCYHVQLMEGDLTHRLEALLPGIGHIQVASVPDRAAPDHGEVNYAHIFGVIKALGWDGPIGAEYKTSGGTAATLVGYPPRNSADALHRGRFFAGYSSRPSLPNWYDECTRANPPEKTIRRGAGAALAPDPRRAARARRRASLGARVDGAV